MRINLCVWCIKDGSYNILGGTWALISGPELVGKKKARDYLTNPNVLLRTKVEKRKPSFLWNKTNHGSPLSLSPIFNVQNNRKESHLLDITHFPWWIKAMFLQMVKLGPPWCSVYPKLVDIHLSWCPGERHPWFSPCALMDTPVLHIIHELPFSIVNLLSPLLCMLFSLVSQRSKSQSRVLSFLHTQRGNEVDEFLWLEGFDI